MTILFQATKYKLLEYFIDSFFDKLERNFNLNSGKIIPIELLKDEMHIRLIRSTIGPGYYRDCRITYINPPGTHPNSVENSYLVFFEFKNSNIDISEDGEDDDDYILVTAENQEWEFIE